MVISICAQGYDVMRITHFAGFSPPVPPLSQPSGKLERHCQLVREAAMTAHE